MGDDGMGDYLPDDTDMAVYESYRNDSYHSGSDASNAWWAFIPWCGLLLGILKAADFLGIERLDQLM